jgi:hypothetical protein
MQRSRRHWRVLEWALFFNTHDSLLYHLPGMLGDTDTFLPAFALSGRPYDFRQVPHPPALPLIDRRQFNDSIVRAAMGRLVLSSRGCKSSATRCAAI